MNEDQAADRDVKTFHDLDDVFRRRKREIFLPALGVFALAAVVAFALPRTYKSTTTVLIEEQEVPREYVAGNIASFADQRLQSINQRIMSSTMLLDLISRFRLYADLKDKVPVDEIVAKMRKAVKFNTISADVVDPRTGRPAQATIAFSVSYEGRNPETVQRVANELASLYLEENLKTREKQSSETSKFMEDEMKVLQARLAALDAKMSTYKKKNLTSLPELAQLNQQAFDQVDRDISRMDDQLRTLREREGYLQEQIANVPRDLPLQEKESLKELRLRLIDLKSRFSDEYPDVVKTKAAIQDLERQMKEKWGGASGDRPDNPAYITLSSQLAGVQSEIGSIKRQIGELRKKRDDYRKRIEASPHVEEGYKGLLVERGSLQAKYDDLNRKTMDAKVAQGLEKEQLAERFSIIDPARLPEKPDSPNIPAILLIGLVLGMGAGVGMAAVRESGDDTVRSPDDLVKIAGGLPVLASVPVIVTAVDEGLRKGRTVKFAAATALVLVAGILLFHFFVMDLDVVWAKVVRRLSI
ncbi:MAG: Wzz/FepE/Etk N-terminal domain-containing protein [Deltaproteobacteria bacterium]|nr:Wzz/FepE/Etk N-terminal domain-containing protein [Deltaproteobacteria bacterium]